MKRSTIDRDNLPDMFPTHRHDPEFWEQLGRAIASFGFLEEVLGKAIFAFTAARRYKENEIDAAYEAWRPKLERALTDQLVNLAEAYGKATRDNPDTTTENVSDLVKDIKSAAVIRNVLCHGSWRVPDTNGAAIPLFLNRQNEVFESPIDVVFLRQIQAHGIRPNQGTRFGTAEQDPETRALRNLRRHAGIAHKVDAGAAHGRIGIPLARAFSRTASHLDPPVRADCS